MKREHAILVAKFHGVRAKQLSSVYFPYLSDGAAPCASLNGRFLRRQPEKNYCAQFGAVSLAVGYRSQRVRRMDETDLTAGGTPF